MRPKPTSFPFLSALSSAFLLSLTVLLADASQDVDVGLTKCLHNCRLLDQHPMVRMCEQWCQMEYQHGGKEEHQQWHQAGGTRDEEDPELTKCLEECRSQPHYDVGMEKKCEDRCRQEHQPGKGAGPEGRDLGGSPDREDPEQRLTECQLKCQQQYREQGPQKKCEETCRKERSEGGANPHWRSEEQEDDRPEQNPYVFGRERLRYEIESYHGYVKVLDKFHEKSKMLLGLANYGISVLVANPRTFVAPVHFDADCVCFVVEGRGTVTTLRKGERKSHEIRKGDIFVTESGSVLYLVSSHRHEKLVLAKFLRSTSLTGQVSHFYAAGGENPESVYKSFSDEVLEAAFNVPRDRFERVFSRQREGAFIEASEEQIEALSRHTKEGGKWPFGDSRGPFNLLQKDPAHSNRHGQLHEADSDDYRKLGRLNLRVSHANISEVCNSSLN